MPTWARFSISPTGQVKDATGLISQGAAPVFPKHPVKVGSKWTGDIGFDVAFNVPRAVATGKATRVLAGLADVGAHKWAKIALEGKVELAKLAFTHRQIGVKLDQGESASPTSRGVVIDSVVPGSPAEKAGLAPGDVIVELGGMPVDTWGDLVYAVNVSPTDRATKMAVLREAARKELRITPRAARSGHIAANGTVKGTVVLDVTEGRIIRQEVDPIALRISAWREGKKREHAFTMRTVMQRVPARDEAAKLVRKLALEFIGAFRLDRPTARKRLEEMLAEDVVMAWSNGRAGKGKTTFLHWYDEAMAEIRDAFRTFAARYDIRSVRRFADGAIVFGKVELSGTLKDGDKPYRRSVWETLVFRKTPAGWRLIHEHSTRTAAEKADSR